MGPRLRLRILSMILATAALTLVAVIFGFQLREHLAGNAVPGYQWVLLGVLAIISWLSIISPIVERRKSGWMFWVIPVLSITALIVAIVAAVMMVLAVS